MDVVNWKHPRMAAAEIPSWAAKVKAFEKKVGSLRRDFPVNEKEYQV